MSKTFQFTNKHGRQVHVDQQHAILLYGNPAMQFDGEVITEKKEERIKENGKYKRDEDGNYIYQTKRTFKLDPESTPTSATSDYNKNGSTIELRSGMTKGGNEAPASKMFKNKKSIQ